MGGGHRESQGDSWLLVLSEARGSLGPGLALVSVAVCTFVLPELSRVALTQELQRASALACATALLSRTRVFWFVFKFFSNCSLVLFHRDRCSSLNG